MKSKRGLAGKSLALAVVLTLSLAIVVMSTGVAAAAPVIDTISPTRGSPGDIVVIHGNGFGANQGSSYVDFWGAKATEYSLWSDTQILARVPVEVGLGVDPVKVHVQGVASNGVDFTVFTPLDTWYLAEGSTVPPFRTVIHVMNPNMYDVIVDVTFMLKGGGNRTVSDKLITPKKVWSVPVPENVDFSTLVQAEDGLPIAVDRTMVWQGPNSNSPEGHATVGVNAPSETWYFPEGSSAWGFETWTLIQNTNNKSTKVTLYYMIEGRGLKQVTHNIPAHSRDSFSMEKDLGAKVDASIEVVSSLPVVAERSVYRNSNKSDPNYRREGHCSIGATSADNNYYLAEGSTNYGYKTYILVQNPNSAATDVKLTFMITGGGTKIYNIDNMKANSRKTVPVATDVPGMKNVDFSTKVAGDRPIIAERAMYWHGGPGTGDTAAREACHDSIGIDAPHGRFYFPEGYTSDSAGSPAGTYTLVQNPNNKPVSVEVAYLPSASVQDVVKKVTQTIDPNGRYTFKMEDKIPNGAWGIMVTSKTAGKRVIAERSMYWNNKGAGTVTIGGYQD